MNLNTPFKSFDPRTKMILGIVAVVVVLFTRNPMAHGFESLAVIMAMWMLGILRKWARSLRLTAPVVALVFFIGLISMDLRTSLLLSLRLFNLFAVSFFFFNAIRPEEIGDGMRKLGMPYEWSFLLTTSLRYVPLVGRKIRLIREAQMSRGIDLRPRLRNAPHFLALLAPLLVQSFLLAEELAMAMEARGFGLKGRSSRRRYRITLMEKGLILLSAAFLAAFLSFPSL